MDFAEARAARACLWFRLQKGVSILSSAREHGGVAETLTRFRANIRIRGDRRGVWILNVIILIFLAFWAPNFFNAGNIHAVLNDASILGIGATGMTILIMAGAFDLSVTAIMGLAPIVALLSAGNLAGPVIVLISVLTGAVLGTINGLIITRGHVAPFVA